MFGRWRKGNDESVLTCPLCGEVSPEDTVECPKCYHQLDKGILEQQMAVSDEDSGTLFDELLAEEEDDEEGEIVDWSRHTFEIDDVAIDVSQYDEDSDSVTLSQSPNFAAIEADTPKPVRRVAEELEEGEYELSIDDAPKDVEKFVVPTSKVDLSPIEEPQHRVDLVVPILPSGVDKSSDDEGPLYDPSAIPEDDEPSVKVIPETNEKSAVSESNNQPEEKLSDKLVTPELPEQSAASINGATVPRLPATPTSDPSTKTTVAIPNIPKTDSTNSDTSTKDAPALPLPPEVRPSSNVFREDTDLDVDTGPSTTVSAPNRDDEIWPWPQQEAHDDLTVKRELRQIMELIKAGDLDEASRNLDKLGPHLGERKDILFHVGVVLKKLGREEALRRMLESARRLHPEDQHVATALTSLGM